MTIRVLSNDVQDHLRHFLLSRRYGEGYDRDGEYLLDQIVGWNRTMIDPVFNRVGYYFDGERCWYEFQLPSGRIVAVISSIHQFKYDLKVKNAQERPISDCDWDMIQALVKRGVLKDCEEFDLERTRRHLRRIKVESGKHIMAFRKRIKAAKEAKRNG